MHNRELHRWLILWNIETSSLLLIFNSARKFAESLKTQWPLLQLIQNKPFILNHIPQKWLSFQAEMCLCGVSRRGWSWGVWIPPFWTSKNRKDDKSPQKANSVQYHLFVSLLPPTKVKEVMCSPLSVFVCLCAGYLKNVVDGSGWNLVHRLGVRQGRTDSIWVKVWIRIWIRELFNF